MIAALAVAGLCLAAEADVTERHDIPYVAGERRDPKQAVDVYRPPGEGHPVFVFVHGGGWVEGDRRLYAKLGRAVAAAGIVTVCVGYRLSPEVKHPEHVRDVAAALRWVRDHISEHGGDPARVCLGGHSAGGHLAALVTLDHRWLAEVDVDPAFIRGVAALSGVYDLRRMAQVTYLRQKLIAPAFGDDPQALEAASPTTYVAAGAPPFWLNNAEIDWGLQRDAAAFADKLRAVDVSVERTVTPETTHITEITRVGDPDDLTTQRLLAFVRRVTAAR